MIYFFHANAICMRTTIDMPISKTQYKTMTVPVAMKYIVKLSQGELFESAYQVKQRASLYRRALAIYKSHTDGMPVSEVPSK